jgi:putative ABC transport system permease protein
MNLATARAFARLKEVGIKKVMGAKRGMLIAQFMGESVLMAFISLVVAIVPVWLLLPAFNKITGKTLSLIIDVKLGLGLLVITLIAGILAGSYPAFYISGFNIVKIFKGKISFSFGELWIRKGLMAFQFAISMILVVSGLVVYQQVQMIQSKNLGYKRDNVIYFDRKGELSQNKTDNNEAASKALDNESFLQEIRNVPGVLYATDFRHSIAAGRKGGTTDVQWPGKKPETEIQFTDIAGGYDFIETLSIAMKEGRSYSRSYGDDKSKIIFNEAAIATMGLTHPIGKTVTVWGQPRQIIGVVKNFNFQSLYESIKPCFIDLNTRPTDAKIMVKIKSDQQRETLNRLQLLYSKFNVGWPFDYKFLDEDYQALYAAEKRVELLSGYFAGVVIIISCLGLFGLAAFTVQKRYKEIGIRKILGSSNANILWLLWREFSNPIMLSLLIALPASYLITKSWLNDFAFRIDLSMWYFLVAGIGIVFITVFTVGTQTISAMRIKPADSLREE